MNDKNKNPVATKRRRDARRKRRAAHTQPTPASQKACRARILATTTRPQAYSGGWC
jgi:hypothetical protein